MTYRSHRRRSHMKGGFMAFSQSEKDWMKRKASAARSGLGSAWSGFKRSSSGALSAAKDRYSRYQDQRRENAAVNAVMKLQDAQRRASLRQSLRSGSISSGGKRRSRRRSSHHRRKSHSRRRKSHSRRRRSHSRRRKSHSRRRRSHSRRRRSKH